MNEKLSKSRCSAILISALTALVFTSVSATLNMLIPYWISGDIHRIIAQPENLSDPAQLIALVSMMLVVYLLLVGIGAFWLHRFFGETYFGLCGAWRWMLFGLLFALISQVAIWFFPDNEIMRWVWPLVSVIGAFFGARWIIPLKKKLPVSSIASGDGFSGQ